MARRFPCASCGAWQRFAPDHRALECGYCGETTPIGPIPGTVREQDFVEWLDAGGAERVATRSERVLPCDRCGATTTIDESVRSTECAFCGHPLVADPVTCHQIPVTGVLPFRIDRGAARDRLRRWLGSLRFAPSGLVKRIRSDDPLQGIYSPHWTFDTATSSRYRGQRGDHYWVTQTMTVMVNGRPQVQTTQVRRTRWSPASGRVRRDFDDVLVLATDSLPTRYAAELAPWGLHEVEPYDPRFLAGFRAETYRVPLRAGFERAKALMDPAIRERVRRDIGGDEQRISHLDTTYREVTFKHLLTPIWISTYRYRDRAFTFLVNGRTGEVQGQRPYSAWKIAGAILLGLALIAGIAWVASQSR